MDIYSYHEGEIGCIREASPLFDPPCPGVETREFRGALAPLKINLPLPLIKGKGIKGIGLISNLRLYPLMPVPNPEEVWR